MNNRRWIDTFLVMSIDGLGDADIRDDREANPQAHGETAFDALYSGRTLAINGKIRCFTLNKLRDMEQSLRQAFADISQERPLIFHSVGGQADTKIMCKKVAPLSIREEQTNDRFFERDFLLTVRASNPRFLSLQEQATNAELGVIDLLTTDGFASGAYNVDSGSGLSINTTSHRLIASSTTIKRFHRSDGYLYSDSDVCYQVRYDNPTAATYTFGAQVRWIDASNYIYGRVDSGVMHIGKFEGGTQTNLATGATLSLSDGSSYWLRLRSNGNVITLTAYTSDPRIDASGLIGTLNYTLTGSDATNFGLGIVGAMGVVWQPANTNTSSYLSNLSFAAFNLTGYEIMQVTNGGNFEAQPIIRFEGPMTNPALLNASNGKAMNLTGSLPYGEQWLIDSAIPSFVDENGDNQFSHFGIGSEVLTLDPGVNSILLTASGLGPKLSGGNWYMPSVNIQHAQTWL
jgi:hypothetical protein